MLGAVPAEDLFARMPAAEAERRAVEIISDPERGNAELNEVLRALPAPWSEQFGEAYLRGLRARIAALTFRREDLASPWLYSLDEAAAALPPGCFARALQPWDVPGESPNLTRDHWQRQIESFTETLRLRQRLMEEIPA